MLANATSSAPNWSGYVLLVASTGIGAGLYRLGSKIGGLGQVLKDLERRLGAVERKVDSVDRKT